jgi:diguanylate cyclase (GGDEF)-like protein/PAS domain S-box-containing protein
MSRDNDFYKDLIDNLYDGVYFVDRGRMITYWNTGAERITGYAARQAVGRSCRDNLLNHVTAEGVPLCLEHCPLAAVMEDGTAREAEVFLHHADGHRVPVLVRGSALRDENGAIVGAVETFSNNAGLMHVRQQVSELRRSALQDSLIGIGNRLHVEGRLHAVIAECRHNKSTAALLFMDIDHFKHCNDTYGHDVGDKVLHMVGNTLRHSLRASDTVGRWGGEEFIAIVYDVPDERTVRRFADKLRVMVECSHFNVGPERLATTISIGATLLRPDDTAESFVRRADQLMYQSKEAGRNRVTVG